MNTQLLANIPLFSKLSESELASLGTLLKEAAFDANQPIFWIGDVGDNLYIIQSGRVQVSYPDDTGSEVVLAALGPGAFFGDLSLLDGGARTASVRTIEPCTLLTLNRADFLNFLRVHPSVAVEVLMVLGNRQRDVIEKLRGVANANQEIAQSATKWQKVADAIAAVSASQTFVLFHVAWFSVWVGYNVVRGKAGWDPFPFGLLTLIVSLEAIFLSIFVLISQNRSGEKDRIRADADYQVNLKAHYEIMQLRKKLDELLEATRSAKGKSGSGHPSAATER